MVRALAPLVLAFTLLLVASAASAEQVMTVKGFVISRSELVLTVQNGGATKVRVLLGPATLITGGRTTAATIAVNDLIRAEGVPVPDHGVQASLVQVVLTGDGFALGRAKENGLTSMFWNWLKNGSLAIPLP